jgi:hypothetical protein
VIAAFNSLNVGSEDCPARVRDAIGLLDRALLVALKPGARGGQTLDEKAEVERRARDLLASAESCGDRTHVLMLDIRNVLGGQFGFS